MLFPDTFDMFSVKRRYSRYSVENRYISVVRNLTANFITTIFYRTGTATAERA